MTAQGDVANESQPPEPRAKRAWGAILAWIGGISAVIGFIATLTGASICGRRAPLPAVKRSPDLQGRSCGNSTTARLVLSGLLGQMESAPPSGGSPLALCLFRSSWRRDAANPQLVYLRLLDERREATQWYRW
jgi:hypothetical protein